MKINCHAHLFNLRTVFSKQSLQIFIDRLFREKWGDWAIEGVSSLLYEALEDKDLGDSDQIYQRLAKGLSKSGIFKDFMKKAGDSIPNEIKLLKSSSSSSFTGDRLLDIFSKLSTYLMKQSETSDIRSESFLDLLDFLLIMLKPDIADVTDKLITQIPDDGGLIALMMDVTKGEIDDEQIFQSQIDGYADMVLRYPGRIFPFFAVNTNRPGFYELMVDCLEHKGFIGLKLYPSLGYSVSPVDNPAMKRVLDYCAANDIPLLMHCSQGGFYARKEFIPNSDPKLWKPILDQEPYKNLRICFAHFGGGQNLVQASIPKDSWTANILSMMETYPFVYADIAYHTEPMDGGLKEKNYFGHLRNLLSSNSTSQRILFGTDYHLVRRRLREDNQWDYFASALTKPQFEQMAVKNSAEFLGLRPGAQMAEMNPTFRKYVANVSRQLNRLQTYPADWLAKAILSQNPAAVFPSAKLKKTTWNMNNKAHLYCWKFFRKTQMFDFQRKHTFEEAGDMLLRQFKYWNKEHESSELHEGKIVTVATELDKALLKIGADYETGFKQNKARDRLRETLKNGRNCLADLATVIDEVYKFESLLDD